MKTITIHARLITSDYDHSDKPGSLLDEDARLGAFRAYRQTLRHIRAASKKNPHVDWRVATTHLRPALVRIAGNYWRDFDFDDRKKSADVKAEARKLIKPLRALVKVLSERPAYVRRGLNFEVTRSALLADAEHQDPYEIAVAANQALLQACETFEERDHRKNGGAVRFQNACRDLTVVWEQIFGKPFPRNPKAHPAAHRDTKHGINFENAAAEFVYVALHEISNRWVKVSQVEEALKTRLGGK